MKNEKGSILVETILAILLSLVFLFGAARTHAAWKKRHRALLEHRNREIKKLRLEEAERLPATGLPRLGGLGLSFPGRRGGE
jgi:hypothetical protein